MEISIYIDIFKNLLIMLKINLGEESNPNVSEIAICS